MSNLLIWHNSKGLIDLVSTTWTDKVLFSNRVSQSATSTDIKKIAARKKKRQMYKSHGKYGIITRKEETNKVRKSDNDHGK